MFRDTFAYYLVKEVRYNHSLSKRLIVWLGNHSYLEYAFYLMN